MSHDYFRKDIKAIDKALEIVRGWNCYFINDQDIVVNKAQVWDCDDNSGEKFLVEPFIEGFVKWNSNTGWIKEHTKWSKIMQALSHYSYHQSNGELVLCDLQGGIDDGKAVLTDPVIMSKSRKYGVTDLGESGISNFFAHHKCNEYCHFYWSKPSNPSCTMTAVKETTMENVAATPNRRPAPTSNQVSITITHTVTTTASSFGWRLA